MNVKADEYVAVFGLSQEGRTIQECGQKINTQIENFIGELKNGSLGFAVKCPNILWS